MKRSLLLLMLIGIFATFVQAEEILLNNGDKITGTIVGETENQIVVETQAMGQITINKEYVQTAVERIDEEVIKADSEVKWDRNLSLGYSQSRGNTEDSEFNGAVNVSRKTDRDEWTGKLTSYISSANKKQDAKKFYGMGRYAYSFGDTLKWYHFYKLEGDQDRFANVDYRFIPSSGVGYWFSDEDDYKVMIEGALGYEYTSYRDNTDSDSEVVLIPRGFIEKVLGENLTFREDITLYPSLGEFGEYRLHSETSLSHPINDRISWKFSLIDDFNSDPAGTSEKNDYRLISSVDYKF